MSRVKLTIATTDYDHFRDFRLGIVNAEGIDHTWLTLGHHEVFARFTFNREWDVSELSFAKFCAQVTREKADIIGLPVVCSRLFRFSPSTSTRRARSKRRPTSRARRSARPNGHTRPPSICAAGSTTSTASSSTTSTGIRRAPTRPAASRRSSSAFRRACGSPASADKSLSEMLASGEIDCALIARPPNCFPARPSGRRAPVPRLSGDGGGLLPTHEGLADHAHHRDPDARPGGASLGRAQSLQRLCRVEAPQPRAPARSRRVALSLAWLPTYARKMRDLFDGDPFPYGIDENRPTLEQFLRYTHEQGIAHRHAKPEEIFPKGIMTSVRV